MPSGPRSVLELTAMAERDVGSAFKTELALHWTVADDVTNFAGALVDRLDGMSGPAVAIHAAAIIMSRLVADLRAVMHLIQLGYVAQAASLVAGMLELAHTQFFIGTDESRAQEWLSHDDLTKAYPGSVRRAIEESARRAGADPEEQIREYETIYRQFCAVKHGNTMALHGVNAVTDADPERIFILSIPARTPFSRRLGVAAINNAIRYVLLSTIGFVGDFVRDEARPTLILRLAEFHEAHQALVRKDKESIDSREQTRDGAPV